MPPVSASDWSVFLRNFPNAHLLQTAAWGELKAAFGWEVARIISGGGSRGVGAQVLFRRLPFGFSLAYVPKGPVIGDPFPAYTGTEYPGWRAFLQELDLVCRKRRTVFLKVEPDLLFPGNPPLTTPAGFRQSPHSIQPPRTLVIDLQGDEAALLARMKQKTRYNIRLALKKGVVIRPSSDLDLFFGLMRTTGERDQFEVHSLDYYRTAYQLFHPRGECELLIAEYEREPLAALMVFSYGKRAWYFYGASADTHRDRMPTYLLQWEAMRWARARGCTVYDLWGVPDAEEETLEANFAERSEGLWGVYRFKRGFGAQLCRSPDPWDRVYQPAIYKFYLWWMSRGKNQRD